MYSDMAQKSRPQVTELTPKKQVLAWLADLGLEVAKADAHVEDTAWSIEVRWNDSSPTFFIAADRPADRVVQVIRVVRIGDDHRKRIRSMRARARSEFKFNLVRDLLASGIQYQLIVDDDKDLAGFIILDRVALESLNDLFDAIKLVHTQSMLAILHVRMVAGDVV